MPEKLSPDRLRARASILIDGRPDNDPTLVRTKPALHPVPRLIEKYDITPSNTPDRYSRVPYVECAVCQEENHWIGWRVESADGATNFLMGHNCAAKHVGVEAHAEMVRLYERTAARAAAMDRYEGAFPHLLGAMNDLTSMQDAPGLIQVEAWRNQMRGSLGSLFSALELASKTSPSVLLRADKVRDYAAEERNQRKSGEDGPAKYKIVYTPEVSLPFPALFSKSFNPANKLREHTETFVSGYTDLFDPDLVKEMETEFIETALSAVQSAARGVLALRSDLAELSKAFSRSHWQAIIKLMNRRAAEADAASDARYMAWNGKPRQRVDHYSLTNDAINYNSDYGAGAVSFPADISVPDCPSLEALIS